MARNPTFVRLGGRGLTMPVRIQGAGQVRASLPGKFIADVLDHFAVMPGDRQQHKQWLIALLAGIRQRQPFDSSLRTALCTEIKDHFRGHAGDFTWLKNRLHQFCSALQGSHDHGQVES